MDIYERLEEDHGKQRGLLGGTAETSGDSAERRRLFTELRLELEAHAAAEEQTFYAELMSHPEGQEQARHSVSEHETASQLVEQLEDTAMDTGAWLQKLHKLRDEVEHHVDEEEADVFPLARKLIPAARARELGDEFAERKRAEVAERKAEAT